MDMKAKEIKYLAQGCLEGEYQGLVLLSWALSHNHGAVFLADVILTALAEPQRLSPVEPRGEFTGLQQESESSRGSWPGALFWCAVTADCCCCLWLFYRVVKRGLDSCFSSLGDQHRLHSTALSIFVALVRGRNVPFPCILAFLCTADHHSRGY